MRPSWYTLVTLRLLIFTAVQLESDKTRSKRRKTDFSFTFLWTKLPFHFICCTLLREKYHWTDVDSNEAAVITGSPLSSHLYHLSMSEFQEDFPRTGLGIWSETSRGFSFHEVGTSCINCFCCQRKMSLVQFITKLKSNSKVCWMLIAFIWTEKVKGYLSDLMYY